MKKLPYLHFLDLGLEYICFYIALYERLRKAKECSFFVRDAFHEGRHSEAGRIIMPAYTIVVMPASHAA